MALTQEEKQRYNRHISLNEIGESGQEKLKQARVLVIGAGGLGSPVLLYLAAAGIGHIGIIDDDTVSASNLQRQILYDNNHVGLPKAFVAQERLQQLNPFCLVTAYPDRLSRENAYEIIKSYHLVIDATDNLPSRYLIDDTCRELNIPFVYGSIREFEGQISVFNYKGGPRYRDVFDYPDDGQQFTQPSGVLGTLPGIIGSLQANEALKIILELPGILTGKLLTINTLTNTFITFNIKA